MKKVRNPIISLWREIEWEWFLDFLIKREIQGRMVDALARNSDEGRGVAAIRFGEVPSNL